jgi:hypothetical protein
MTGVSTQISALYNSDPATTERRKPRTMKFWLSLVALAALSLSIAAASVAEAQNSAPPEPEKFIRGMCDYLNSLQQFSYQTEVSYDIPEADGQTVQDGFDMETYVRRPDRLRIDAEGDSIDKQFFYNSRTITLYDRQAKMYAVMDVPPDIEGALEKAQEDFDLRVALADLASPKLCDLIFSGGQEPRNLGVSRVRGLTSHHMVLDRKEKRFQIWIETGDRPLPRKIVITDKKLSGSPQWTAYLNHWNVLSKVNESMFAFVPPRGSQRIQFMPVKTPGGPK